MIVFCFYLSRLVEPRDHDSGDDERGAQSRSYTRESLPIAGRYLKGSV